MNDTRDHHRSNRRVVLCWSIVLVASLLLAVTIAMLAPRFAPVRQGTSHTFWRIACGVSLVPQLHEGWGGDAYYIDDRWAAYDASHFHGSDIYYVSVADVSADFDAAVDELEQAFQRGDDSAFIRGYATWRDDKEQPRNGPALLESIKRERRRALIDKDIALLAYSVADEQRFWQRWQRADWYWANIVLEWSFLSGLVLFALRPVIRGDSSLRWAVHVGLSPLLFLLPCYLGYATFSFTSAGPTGGILYPLLLTFCRGGSVTTLDRWVLGHLPQVLEPLSTPIGSPMALTGMGMPGPTSAIVVGILCGGVLLAMNLGYRRRVRRRS